MKLYASICATALFVAGACSMVAAQQPQNPPSYFKSYAGLVWNPHDHYWRTAQKEVDKSVLSILVQDQTELAQGIRYRKFFRGAPQVREVALTFDDGPHTAYTPQLLAILSKYHVHATFFVVGERAEQAPDLVREEVAEGNEVGNHTYHHVNLTKVSPEQAATEIKACGEVLHAILGRSPHLFRPPGGDYNATVAMDAEALGYTTILWTDDPGDFKRPAEKLLVQRTIKNVSPGAVILLHDGIRQTIDVLPQIIETLRAQGYQFVTVDQLMRDRNQPYLAKLTAHKAKLAYKDHGEAAVPDSDEGTNVRE